MAVYQGARPRSSIAPRVGLGLPPRGAAEDVVLPRRRARSTVRARRRSNRVGFILGAIVVAFALGFFSLSQSMRVTATGYQIDRLVTEQQQLEAQARELQSDLDRLGAEPAVRKEALSLGLGALDRPVVLQPR